MNPNQAPPQVTDLLVAWSNGDKLAYDQLVPLVYDELHRLAHRYMSGERPAHTLPTTALVDEAYLRLVDQKVHWQPFTLLCDCRRSHAADPDRLRPPAPLYEARRGGPASRVG